MMHPFRIAAAVFIVALALPGPSTHVAAAWRSTRHVAASGAAETRSVSLRVAGGEKERLLFRSKPAGEYPARDAHEGVVVAADLFDTREKSKAVFGKLDLQKAGILPVLVVITNATDRTVRLDNLEVRLLTADRQKIEPTPAETATLRLKGKGKGGDPRDSGRSPFPRLPRGGGGAGLELQVHEFNMRMAVPNSTISGFFYFDVGRGRAVLAGAKVYLTEMRWAHNAQPLMYFEVNLDDVVRGAPPADAPSAPSN